MRPSLGAGNAAGRGDGVDPVGVEGAAGGVGRLGARVAGAAEGVAEGVVAFAVDADDFPFVAEGVLAAAGFRTAGLRAAGRLLPGPSTGGVAGAAASGTTAGSAAAGAAAGFFRPVAELETGRGVDAPGEPAPFFAVATNETLMRPR